MAVGDRKLKAEDVLLIRRLLKEGVPNVVLANKYNVSKQAISDLKAGRSWSNLFEDENGNPYFTHSHRFMPRTQDRIMRCTCGETRPWPK
jgi:hypothetical protein